MATSNVSQFPLPPKIYFSGLAAKSEEDLPIPPKEPEDGKYACFGMEWSTSFFIPSLESSGRQKLYDEQKEGGGLRDPKDPNSFSKCACLQKLNNELVSEFIDIVDGLASRSPTETVKTKIDHLETLLINMHHLINLLRVDQAYVDARGLVSLEAKKYQILGENLTKQREHAEKTVAEMKAMVFLDKKENAAVKEEGQDARIPSKWSQRDALKTFIEETMQSVQAARRNQLVFGMDPSKTPALPGKRALDGRNRTDDLEKRKKQKLFLVSLIKDDF